MLQTQQQTIETVHVDKHMDMPLFQMQQLAMLRSGMY